MEMDIGAALPIVSLEQLCDTVNACAQRAVEVAAERSFGSNYAVQHQDMEDLITFEDYLQYFSLIANAVESREEVMDLSDADDMLTMVVTREPAKELSLAEKARRYEQIQLIQDRDRECHEATNHQSHEKALYSIQPVEFISDRSGRPLEGGDWDEPWQRAAAEKFLGSTAWCKPPEGFAPLLATHLGHPVVVYAMGLTLDQGKFDGDLDFMNAVGHIVAGSLNFAEPLSRNFIFRYMEAGKDSESGELLAILPATISEKQLSRLTAKLENLTRSAGFPLNALDWSRAQYTAAKEHLEQHITSSLVSDIAQYSKVPSEWLRRSVPALAGPLCEMVAERYGWFDPLFPQHYLTKQPHLRNTLMNDVLCHEIGRLTEFVPLTTYDKDHCDSPIPGGQPFPTKKTELLYGALREVLAKNAPEGERPVSVEEYLATSSYEQNEALLNAYRDMFFEETGMRDKKPDLENRLKNAEGRKRISNTSKRRPKQGQER